MDLIYKIYDNDNRLTDDHVEAIKRATEATLAMEFGDADTGDQPLEISISIVDKEEMHEINSGFRGVDSVTDVLSFPQYENVPDLLDDISFVREQEDGREILIGDVVICYDKVLEQAEEYGTGPGREFIYLYVHSLLHLLGYDHMTGNDKAVMRGHEEQIIASL